MPVLDVVTAFCYGPDCRQERQWRRALPTSRVYACTGCERTREFSERAPGSASGSGVSVSIPGPDASTSAREALMPPSRPAPKKKPITSPKETKTMPKTDTQTKRAFQSPMLAAIDGAVQRALQPITEDIRQLMKKVEGIEVPEDALTMKDLEKQVDELLESRLPEFVNRAVLQMLATPKTAIVKPKSGSAAAAAPASGRECGHKKLHDEVPDLPEGEDGEGGCGVSLYARDTSVSVDRSKAEIERTLSRYGAEAFAYAAKETAAMVEFQLSGKRIRFIMPTPARSDQRFTHYSRKGSPYRYERSESQSQAAYDQELRRRWRALALVIKAKLEAVASEITTLEQEFLAHIVLPGGRTVGDMMIPRIDEAYASGKVPALGWEGDGR